MTCRVKVDVANGVVELEGEASFVTEFFDRFSDILKTPGFGDAANGSVPEDVNQIQPDKRERKPTRKKAPNPPKGHSCRDRIKTLVVDGFFSEKRTPVEIVEGLAKKGWTHNGNQVGASLTSMFNAGEISRTKEDGSFKYYWDRD